MCHTIVDWITKDKTCGVIIRKIQNKGNASKPTNGTSGNPEEKVKQICVKMYVLLACLRSNAIIF